MGEYLNYEEREKKIQSILGLIPTYNSGCDFKEAFEKFEILKEYCDKIRDRYPGIRDEEVFKKALGMLSEEMKLLAYIEDYDNRDIRFLERQLKELKTKNSELKEKLEKIKTVLLRGA